MAPVGDSATPRCSASVNQKVEPTPGVLSTPQLPPISSHSLRTIARPRPVPPKRRVMELSVCEKDWNRRGSASGGMPTPVSCTSKR